MKSPPSREWGATPHTSSRFVYLVGVSVVIALGASASSDEIDTTYSATSPDPLVAVLVAQNDSRQSENRIAAEPTGRKSRSADIRSLDDLEQFSSPFKRSLELLFLLTDADERQVLRLLEESNEAKSQKRLQLQKPILQRLAQLNPRKAYEQIELLEQGNTSQLIDWIFMEWSSFNLEEAVSFAESLSDDEKFAALRSVLAERSDLSEEERLSIARQLGNEQHAINLNMQERLSKPIVNPEDTWNELVGEVQDNPGQFWMLATVARAWVEKDGLRVLDQISESMTNSQTRQHVLHSVLLNAAIDTPEIAFGYALKLDSNSDSNPGGFGFVSLVSAVTNTWVKSDPRSALDAASGVEQIGLRRKLEESVVTAWANQNPQDVLSVLDTLPEHVHNSATQTAISSWVNEDPHEAASFVATMEGGSRATAASSLVIVWSRQPDYKDSIEWVLNDPGISDLKGFLLPELLSHLAYVDPQFAMEKALEQPIADGGLGLEATVIFRLSYNDIDEAIRFLPQVRPGSTKTAAYGYVGKMYIQHGATEDALNLAQELPSSSRSEYFQELLTTWTRSDPESLLNSIDSLPTSEIKSKAARVLTVSNKRHGSLSEKQVQSVEKYLLEEDAESIRNR